MSLPTTAARDIALAKFSQQPYLVLSLEIDTCTRTFGTAPCLATGTPCYNTFKTCKFQSAYDRSTRTLKFTRRGASIPAGEPLRPYIISDETIPAAIDMEAGLARRGMLKITLADEPCPDREDDPYWAQRSTPAGATYWARFMARNPNYVGRKATLMRGFAVTPWDWTTFLSEQYIIDQITLNGNGTATITLKDPLKLADRQKIPVPTYGKLAVELKNLGARGYAVAATATSITLDAQASPLDGAYIGFEVAITQNSGSGQYRTITTYDGAQRLAVVASWLVLPDTTSIYEVSALKLSLASGTGAQYANPATSGKREFVQIGAETIEYTAQNGDVLSWDSSARRAAFGSKREDHKLNDNVQLCRAFIDQPVLEVIRLLLLEGGILDAQIDLQQLASEVNDYLSPAFDAHACLSKPEDASKLLAELLSHIGYNAYWLPQDQRVHIVSCLPHFSTPVTWTDDHIVAGSLSVETLDSLRITHSMARIGKINHSGSDSDAVNFGGVTGTVDISAMNANEYGDARPDIFFSRWFESDIWEEVQHVLDRRLQQRRNAPRKVILRLSAKDFTAALGETIILDTNMLTDASGQNAKPRCVVTKITGGKREVELRVMNWPERPAFIAPNDAADFPANTAYAHIAHNDGLMPDATNPYTIT